METETLFQTPSPVTKLSNILTPVEFSPTMAHHTLKIIRSYSTPDGCSAIAAVMLNGDRVTVWPGPPPEVAPSTHPVLAIPLGQGQGPDGPCWVEHRPGQWALANICNGMDPAHIVQIATQLADGLASLHAQAKAHGAIDLESVVLSPSGTPFLIGAGRIPGTPEADIAALLHLLSMLTDLPAIHPQSQTAASLAAKLREHPDPLTPLSSWLTGQPSEVTDGAELILQLVPMGFLDEVQPDIGTDAVGIGLLDRWQPAPPEEERTEDPTESVDFQRIHAQSRQQLLSDLLLTLDRVVDSDQSVPSSAILRRHLTADTLDPIPALNGLPHGPIHNPGGHSERTADVSIPEITRPTADNIEETTGVTNAESVGQQFVTRLLFAAVLGMAGAAIMLLLVWMIIDDVF